VGNQIVDPRSIKMPSIKCYPVIVYILQHFHRYSCRRQTQLLHMPYAKNINHASACAIFTTITIREFFFLVFLFEAESLSQWSNLHGVFIFRVRLVRFRTWARKPFILNYFFGIATNSVKIFRSFSRTFIRDKNIYL